MNSNQNEQLNNNVLKNISVAGERNIEDKRKNFEHLTLLAGTVLGFSAGLSASSGGHPNTILIASWIADVLAVIIGSAYLVVEAESRYFRSFIVAEKQLELARLQTSDDVRRAAQSLLTDAQKALLDVSTASNMRERVFILFAKYQRMCETIFYASFVVSLILLVFSFV